MKENDPASSKFISYLKVTLGIMLILIGGSSLFQLIFAHPVIESEKENFLTAFPQTFLIGVGIWLIMKRDEPVARSLSNSRIKQSLVIITAVILLLFVIIFYFFDGSK